MANIDSDVKRVVASREEAAADARRPASPDPALSARKRDVVDLLGRQLQTAGFDAAPLDKMRKRHRDELERVLEMDQAAAVAQSVAPMRALMDDMESRIDGIRHLSALPAGSFSAITLRRPFLIWAGKHSSAILVDTHIADDDSWAKVRATITEDDDAGRDGWNERRVSFWFMWQNESDYFAVISAHAYLAVYGYIATTAYGSGWNVILAGPWVTNMWLNASLSWWKWWAQPQTRIELARQELTSATVENGVVGSSHGERVNRVDRLESGSDFITIPPHETVVLEVAVSFAVGIEDGAGKVDFDFASGEFRIACPWMNILLLTPRP